METIEDAKRFREMLENSTREQLVEIIFGKAQSDRAFECFVKDYLNTSDSADEILRMFLKCAERSRGRGEPDIDIIENGGNLFLEKMKNLTNNAEKFKAYIVVANTIDVLVDEGAGMYNDDDWIIVEIAKKCLDNAIEICEFAYTSGDKGFLNEAAGIIDTVEILTGCTCLDDEREKIFSLLSKCEKT